MTRRPLSLLLALVLGAALTACGDDTGGSPSSSSPFDQVQIEGEPGEAPEVTWDGRVEVDSLVSEVLSEGDGEEVQDGDQVLVHVWIGNGYTQQEAYSSYGQQPQQLTVDDKQLGKVFLEGIEGHTMGSRVAVAAPAEDAFGSQGNPQIGIGNKDSVVVVIDLVDTYTPPEPQDVAASRFPDLVIEGGKPTGFDFSGVPEPKADGDLLRAVIRKGKGEPVTTDMTVTANYLGAVHGARKPFDESYSKKPVPFPLDGVVEGWTYGLEGVPVGSRVLLQIPPDLGYGAQEQPGIPADSTLYFVVDVVKAK